MRLLSDLAFRALTIGVLLLLVIPFIVFYVVVHLALSAFERARPGRPPRHPPLLEARP